MTPRRFRPLGAPVLIATVVALAACSQTPVATQSTGSTASTAQSSEAEATPSAVGLPTLDGTIDLVVNQAPGGGLDTSARLLEVGLEELLDADIQVINNAEAGGVQGPTDVFNADPDGRTLGFLLLPRTIQQQLLLDTPYDTLEFTPIAGVNQGKFALVVRADAPWEDFAAFVEASKDGALNVATTGAGSATDLQAARLADVAGAQITRVPFDGAAPARTEVLGGHVDAAVVPLDANVIDSPDFRILVVPTADRVDEAPDAPAMSDFGMDAADVSFYQVVFGPPGMSDELQASWEEAIRQVLDAQATQDAFDEAGITISFLTGEELRQLITEQTEIVEQYQELLGG